MNFIRRLNRENFCQNIQIRETKIENSYLGPQHIRMHKLNNYTYSVMSTQCPAITHVHFNGEKKVHGNRLTGQLYM